MEKIKVVIMGAAGRDFHNFNTYFRDNINYQVIAFTAAQIPNIDGRRYPPELSGHLYPQGIPILPESALDQIMQQNAVHQVVFSYSDVPHTLVMHRASQVLAGGADFRLMGGRATMIKSQKPVVAVCAVRTGSGKSQTTRAVCDALQRMGLRVVAIRHPMPYGDLRKQIVQRFAEYADLEKYQCTIEEREEYEPHIDRGIIVYAGIDYAAILQQAEAEADVIVWDGGNNDFPFYQPDVWITLVDPHRAGHEIAYYPGETNLRAADIVIINKIGTADYHSIRMLYENIHAFNGNATVIEAASPLFVQNPEKIRGKRVLVIEDGPTLTHGEMAFGAAYLAAQRFGAAEIVDPRPFAVDSIKAVYQQYPKTGTVLPAMGYGLTQMRDLENTINNTPCDLVLVGTPIDLTRLLSIRHPMERVRYELQVIGQPTLDDTLLKFVKQWAI
ncbi:MAG: cyclic 2,3-diphosphoglycerate synthase [Anaerolineae bacterium]|nr:cyclic 2,3-diphosphoglycerate synthase [Anaerolineae bacterium]